MTKLTGSLNAKVQKMEQKKETMGKETTLVELEEKVERLLWQECVVVAGEDMLHRVRVVFEACREDSGEEEAEAEDKTEKVDLNTLVATIAEDEYFQEHMQSVVRESVDGEHEKLEDLLNRILTDFKDPVISWLQFLGYFSKRGRLQGYH